MNENILTSNIARLRREAGLTQEQLATRLGISYQAVSKWENGLSCPDVQLLPEIADIFNISIDALFGRAGLAAAEDIPSPPTVMPGIDWPDDNNIYVVLFRGHQLLTEEPPLFDSSLRENPFVWEGPVCDVHSKISVVVNGDVQGDVFAGNDVNCDGVGGDVNAGVGVTADDIGGNVNAGESVACDNIGGSVEAGVNITCDEICGDATAGCNITCDEICGDATAGCSINCDSVDDGDGRGYAAHANFEWNGKKFNKTIRMEDLDEETRQKIKNISEEARRAASNAGKAAGGISKQVGSLVNSLLKDILK